MTDDWTIGEILGAAKEQLPDGWSLDVTFRKEGWSISCLHENVWRDSFAALKECYEGTFTDAICEAIEVAKKSA